MKLKILVALLFLTAISCGKKAEAEKTEKTVENKTEQVAEDIKNISMDIGGMTCEIGCAKLIESKLAKTDGVKNVKVVFNDSIGTVTYDANKISQKELVNTVEKIADGQLYIVKKVTETE